MFVRSLIHTIYEPSTKSIMMESARALKKKEQIGSFAGLQQTMKGAAQVMGSFWGSYLASRSAFTPLYLSCMVAIANALVIYASAHGPSDLPADEPDRGGKVATVSGATSPFPATTATEGPAGRRLPNGDSRAGTELETKKDR